MNNISLSDLFSKKLKSPLLNARWSWGAINANNAVVLRVFQHEFEKRNVHIYSELWEDSLGKTERKNHVDLVRLGSPLGLIVCLAENTSEGKERIKQFNEQEVFVSGRLIDDGVNVWCEVIERVSLAEWNSRYC